MPVVFRYKGRGGITPSFAWSNSGQANPALRDMQMEWRVREAGRAAQALAPREKQMLSGKPGDRA